MKSARRAKIVCTLGPATDTPDQVAALIRAGMDVARLNFSHGSHDDHARTIKTVREVSAELGQHVAVLQDLQGPKIRIGALAGGQVELQPGAHMVLTTEAVEQGDATRMSVSYAGLPHDVQPGDPVLLSDGLLRLEVTGIAGNDVECAVVDGGILRQRAGINLPGAELSVPSLTEKDERDLLFGAEQVVDIVALSFVRRAADVVALRDALRSSRGRPTVVAKLEKPQAIEALDAILDVADGVMVARGDLGVEISPERVPFIQKQIIQRAAAARVPVITATQMLESMITNPRPTRAEASDVANAIFDGTDAVMLSGETSIGHYPLEAVRMMDRIVREAERNMDGPATGQLEPSSSAPCGFEDATADAAARVAANLHAAAIVAFTHSGFTARLVSKYRPVTPIVAFTPYMHVLRQLSLFWGVRPLFSPVIDDTNRLIEAADAALRDHGLVQAGDTLVFIAGTAHVHGSTNMIRLHRAGDRVN